VGRAHPWWSHTRSTNAEDRLIFSTSSFTPFEVLVNMIVLQAVQVLHQSSAGMDRRVATKEFSPASINGCVCVSCVLVCVLFFCASSGCLSLSVVSVPLTCCSSMVPPSSTDDIWYSSSFRSRVVLPCGNTRLISASDIVRGCWSYSKKAVVCVMCGAEVTRV
jgi:hypothetical protein